MGIGGAGDKNKFSEHGYVAYQIRGDVYQTFSKTTFSFVILDCSVNIHLYFRVVKSLRRFHQIEHQLSFHQNQVRLHRNQVHHKMMANVMKVTMTFSI